MLPTAESYARRYAAAPLFDPAAVPAWRELAALCARDAALARATLSVIVSDDSEPYPDAAAMCDDIRAGRFIVSRAHSTHPLWTAEQNVDFRIAHDVFGHYLSGGDFGWTGELAACGAHSGRLTPLARLALETECLGQTGFAIARGTFPPQKVGLL